MSFLMKNGSFGTERRNQSLNKSTDPGPGAYTLPPKFADVPRYALTTSFQK